MEQKALLNFCNEIKKSIIIGVFLNILAITGAFCQKTDLINSSVSIKNKKNPTIEIKKAEPKENNSPKKEITHIKFVAPSKKRETSSQPRENDLEHNTRLYSSFMSSGDNYFDKGEFLKAQEAYSNAMALKPQEEAPQQRLVLVEKAMAEVSSDFELNNLYDSIILAATAQFRARLYDLAERSYISASKLKPDAAGPKEQIKYIQEIKDKEAQLKAKNEAIKNEELFKDLVVKGDKSVKEQLYIDAYSSYMWAKEIHPTDEWCIARIKIVENQLDILDPDWRKSVEKEASFNGSWSAYVKKEIESHIDELTEAGESGVCRVRFIVSKDGSVSNVEALTMKGSKLAKIATNVIRNGPKWTPAQVNGRYVNAYREQEIGFTVQDQ